MELTVRTNFLEKDIFKFIQNSMLGEIKPAVPWYVLPNTDYPGDNNKQLVHYFYDEQKPLSTFNDILKPLYDKLNIISLLRVKANLTTYQGKEKNKFHRDYDNIDCKTAVYYINTNDGGTKFENSKFIKSEENKIVIFPSKLKHKVVKHTKGDPFRVVINLNYF